MPEKEWRPVPGFEGFYEVSSDGQVRGCLRVVGAANGKTKVIKPKPLKSHPQTTGHLFVDLYKDRKRTKRSVHRLVLEVFGGPAPDGTECCHRNGNPADNRIENLYWGTRTDNNLDRVRHGHDRNAIKTHCPQGHPYESENLYVRPRGGRICKTCSAAAGARYKARKRAERAAA